MKSFEIGASLCVALLCGCATDVQPQDPESRSTQQQPEAEVQPDVLTGEAGQGAGSEPVGELSQGLSGGESGNRPSVVGLYISWYCPPNGSCKTEGSIHSTSCTGALVSRNSVLTAAHCVDPEADFPGSTIPTGDMAVSYQNSVTGVTSCLTRSTGSLTGKCVMGVPGDYHSMLAYVDPDYVGTYRFPTETGHDVAILKSTINWPTSVTKAADFARIGSGSARSAGAAMGVSVKKGDTFYITGFGTTGAALETPFQYTFHRDLDLLDVDYVGGEHFYNNAGAVRLCNGDSGAPALAPTAVAPITLGVLSNLSNPETCATSGAKQRFAKTAASIDWIKSTLVTLGASCTSNQIYKVSSSLFYSVVVCDQ